MTSLSRRGAPSDVADDGLLSKVDWRSGSALDPEVYTSLLAGQDYIIHSIGILFESNPLYNIYKSQPVEYSSSYKALIRDTANVAAEASASAKIKAFGYISAARYGVLGSALLPQYMAMKMEAEELLLKRTEFRSVIARPGFMYGSDRWATIPMSFGASAMTLFTAGLFPKSLSVDTVAKAMLSELLRSDDPAESKIMEVSDVSEIASQ